MRLGVSGLVVFLMLRAQAASAQETLPRYQVHAEVDLPVFAGAMFGAALMSFFPFGRQTHPVPSGEEWFGFDEPTKSVFSNDASDLSDVLLISSLTLPLAVQVGSGVDAAFADGALLYGQALSITWLITQLTKYAVSRPRPYTHSKDPRVTQFADEQGLEAYLSFFSGHSSLSFAGAVGGAALFSMRTANVGSRSIVWGAELMLASFTATSRVRAGRHYPTDVLVGALVGTGVGLVVPILHAKEGSGFAPHAEEWLAAGSGLALGTSLGVLLSFSDALTPLGDEISLAPFGTGAGLALSFGF